MAVIKPLHTTINVTNGLTKKLVTDWNTAIHDILSRGNNTTISINPTDANRYIFDFNGLLNFIGIPVEFQYPHILANGLTTSTMYDGKKTTIISLDKVLLDTYYKAFNR